MKKVFITSGPELDKLAKLHSISTSVHGSNPRCTELLREHITKTRPCNIQQYFTAVKNVNFQMKNYNIFLFFAQNIDCGYTLEPPH